MSLEEHRKKVMAQKRRAALDAGVAAFLQNGYDRTTLAQIAHDAGISTGTLFKHFPTKAALFGAIMEEMWAPDPSLEQPLPPAGNPAAGLSTIGHDYADRLRHPQTEPFFRVIIAEAPRFPELGQALFERGKAPYLERLYAYLRSEVAAGTLCIDNVPLAGRQFFGMINDVIFWPRFLAPDLTISSGEVDSVIREAVCTMLARYSAHAASGDTATATSARRPIQS
jgi:AcrR family transcriptional regulator